MKTVLLRAFCPTDGKDVAFGEDDEKIRFVGPDPVYDVAGCSKTLKLRYRGEDFYASATSVEPGSELIAVRGEGQRIHRQKFARAGVVLDVVVPRDSPALSAVRQLRSRGLGLRVNFEALTGVERDDCGSSAFHCTTARIRSVSLAMGDDADAQITIIE
jgi:hypothetical protein